MTSNHQHHETVIDAAPAIPAILNTAPLPPVVENTTPPAADVAHLPAVTQLPQAEDALREEIKQQLKEELRVELSKELRQELITGLGRDISSTGRQLLTRMRKAFFPTEKEVLVKQLNHQPLLRHWDIRFSDSQTLTEIEEQLVKVLSVGGRAKELQLQCRLVNSYRLRRSKRLLANFILDATAQID